MANPGSEKMFCLLTCFLNGLKVSLISAAGSSLLEALLEAEVFAKGDMDPKAGRLGLGMEGMVRSPLSLVARGTLRGPNCWGAGRLNWWGTDLTAWRCFRLQDITWAAGNAVCRSELVRKQNKASCMLVCVRKNQIQIW